MCNCSWSNYFASGLKVNNTVHIVFSLGQDKPLILLLTKVGEEDKSNNVLVLELYYCLAPLF